MKKFLLVIFVMAFSTGLFAQENDYRRGYIGLNVGPAISLGDLSDAVSTGAQIAIVNFGYLFSENVGISASWFENSFNSRYGYDASVGFGGLVAGPLFSTASKDKKVEFDLKPTIGFGSATLSEYDSDYSSDLAFVFGLGGAIRWNCASRFALSFGADYYYAAPEEVDMSSLAFTVGFSYRLK